jgi:HAD superfamily hydrolase (TIGR01549 family)
MTPEEIQFISFDLDGTLVELDFSEWVWGMGIPELFAKKNGMSLDTAKKIVEGEYLKVSDGSMEWYDIKYWFDFFQLDGHWRALLNRFSDRIRAYPESSRVLQALSSNYELIIISNAAREFIDIEVDVAELRRYFSRIFSATSDFGQVKKTAEFYGHICQLLGISPTEMIHVGDNWQFDYLTPKEIGIRAFYVDRSWVRSGDDIIRNLEEVRQRLLL